MAHHAQRQHRGAATSHRRLWDPAKCALEVTNGTFSGGEWRWRSPHAQRCHLHTIGTEAAQDLLAGRQFLYIGNSVLRQDMHATLHVALGKGVDTPIDDMRGAGLHTAATLIVDLTNRTIHKFTPSSLPLCRVPPHRNSYFTGDINLATDNGPTTYGASWHVSWPAAEQHANLDAQLAGTFPSSPRWTELLQGSPAPVLRMRVWPDGRSFVQAFLLARRPVALASSNLTAELSEWARRGCVAAGCRLQTRQVRRGHLHMHTHMHTHILHMHAHTAHACTYCTCMHILHVHAHACTYSMHMHAHTARACACTRTAGVRRQGPRQHGLPAEHAPVPRPLPGRGLMYSMYTV